jgi:hypothetical protein
MMAVKSDDGCLHTQWSAEEQAAYEAYRARHHGELRACTCGIVEANMNCHAEGCAYLASVRKIDEGWYEHMRERKAERAGDVDAGEAV